MVIRVQGNNLFDWFRNDLGVDPEANNPFIGGRILQQPKSWTLSLNVNF